MTIGCLTISFDRKGGVDASASRIGGIDASATRIHDLAISIGLVCSTSIGDLGIIWASDGKLITLEGGYLIQA